MLSVSMLRMMSRHWWVLLLRGVLAVLFGLMAFWMPGLTLVTLVLLCGFYFMLDGVTLMFVGGQSRAWPLLIAGSLGIVASILTFVYPALTAFWLLILIAIWSISRGILEIVAAIRLRKELSHEWLLVTAGALSILFGVLLLINPLAGALAVVWLIGFYALLFGITMCVLAFRLRRTPAELTTAPLRR